jgi:predicted ATP-grasp superfamily ATP-dependent carboligase
MALYEIEERPDLESPVLVISLEGWIDAGLGAANALATLLGSIETVVVATFNSDTLLDHRARRPIMHLVDGVNTGLSWPAIELRAASDRDGNDLLLLVGAEPDHEWNAFSNAAVDLALEFGSRMAVGIGAYPAPVPHTRPAGLAVAAATAELARQVGTLRATIDVPAGVQAAIERRCADVGLPAIGLWAQVPHYAAAMPYPAASAALIDGLADLTGLSLDSSSLREQARAARTRIDELINENPEHRKMVELLEAQVDSATPSEPAGGLGQGPLPSGDELAAEFERFLRDQGS